MDRIGAIVHAWPTTFPAANQPRPVVNPADSGEKSADSVSSADAATAASPQPGQSAGSQPPQDAQTAALISQLAQRDRQVRAHEAAHVAAGGQYVRGGAQLSYSTGPDGRAYATGGEVSIDRSPVPNDPQATIRKLQQVQRAALAPVDPSPQDRSVAAAAAMGITQAQIELAQRRLNAYRSTATSATTMQSSGFRAAA